MGKKNFEGVIAVALKDLEATPTCPDGVRRGQLVYVIETLIGEGKFSIEALREVSGALQAVGKGEYDTESFDLTKFDKRQKLLIKPFLKEKEKARKRLAKQSKKPSRARVTSSIGPDQPPSSPQPSAAKSVKHAATKRFSTVVDKLKRQSNRLSKLATSSTSSSNSSSSSSSSRRRSSKSASAKVLFGVPLDKVMGEHSPPVFLLMAGAHVLAHLQEEGLFRVSGSASSLVELKSLLEETERLRLRAFVKAHGRHAPVPPADQCPVDFSQVPVHTAAGLVKLFLRDLPAPLLPSAMYRDFLGLVAVKDHAQCLAAAAALLRQLPPRNLCLYLWLVRLLERVAAVPENLMDYANLAIVFGPTILLAPDAAFSMDQIAVTTFLLQHSAALFGTAEEQQQGAGALVATTQSVLSTNSQLLQAVDSPGRDPAMLNYSEDELPSDVESDLSDLSDADYSVSDMSESDQDQEESLIDVPVSVVSPTPVVSRTPVVPTTPAPSPSTPISSSSSSPLSSSPAPSHRALIPTLTSSASPTPASTASPSSQRHKEAAAASRPPRKPRRSSHASMSEDEDARKVPSPLSPRIRTLGINMDELRSRLKRRGESEEAKEERLREEENRVQRLIEAEAQQVAAVTQELQHQVAVAQTQNPATVTSPIIRRLVLPQPPQSPAILSQSPKTLPSLDTGRSPIVNLQPPAVNKPVVQPPIVNNTTPSQPLNNTPSQISITTATSVVNNSPKPPGDPSTPRNSSTFSIGSSDHSTHKNSEPPANKLLSQPRESTPLLGASTPTALANSPHHPTEKIQQEPSFVVEPQHDSEGCCSSCTIL